MINSPLPYLAQQQHLLQKVAAHTNNVYKQRDAGNKKGTIYPQQDAQHHKGVKPSNWNKRCFSAHHLTCQSNLQI
jgi:hypothetical protein